MNSITFVGEHPRTHEIRWHRHETWEMIYCTSGQGILRFQDGRAMEYRAGEVVMIPPECVHTNFGEEGTAWIHLNLAEPTCANPDLFKLQDENSSLLQALSQARLYFTSDNDKKELILSALGDLISSYVIAFYSRSEYPETVVMIREGIHRNFTNPDFELDALIRSLPFHYDYLRKVFKKEIGLSPLEYLTSLRMKKAEHLLGSARSSNHAISEIAQQCGYENALYFSRVFRKYYGCSPTQYLKMHRDSNRGDPERAEAPSEEYLVR